LNVEHEVETVVSINWLHSVNLFGCWVSNMDACY